MIRIPALPLGQRQLRYVLAGSDDGKTILPDFPQHPHRLLVTGFAPSRNKAKYKPGSIPASRATLLVSFQFPPLCGSQYILASSLALHFAPLCINALLLHDNIYMLASIFAYVVTTHIVLLHAWCNMATNWSNAERKSHRCSTIME